MLGLLRTVPTKIAGRVYLDEVFAQKKYGLTVSYVYLALMIGNPVALILGGIFR